MVIYLLYVKLSQTKHINRLLDRRHLFLLNKAEKSHGFDIGETWSELPEENNVYFTTHADIGPGNTDPDVIAFRKAFQKKFPGHEPDAFTALGHDTVMMTAAAIEKAGSLDVDAIRTALSSLQNFKGLTGNISFEKGSHVPVKSVAIFRVDGGAEKDVREILPMSIPSP